MPGWELQLILAPMFCPMHALREGMFGPALKESEGRKVHARGGECHTGRCMDQQLAEAAVVEQPGERKGSECLCWCLGLLEGSNVDKRDWAAHFIGQVV